MTGNSPITHVSSAVYTEQLANFTKWLVFVTVAVAGIGVWQGRQLWHHARIAESSLTDLERAYVTAGIVGTGTGTIQGVDHVILRASVSNYGKTPGFIDHIHWHVGPYGATDPGELPITSDGYQNHIFVGWVIGPDTGRGEELQADVGMAQLPLPEPLIFHGLVTYTDIFEKAHYCGFAYRINQNGSWQPISKVDAYVRRD